MLMPTPAAAQAGQDRHRLLRFLHQDRLGDLQRQSTGRQAVAGQEVRDLVGQREVHQAGRADVDRHGQVQPAGSPPV
jgi:hypothetical protein